MADDLVAAEVAEVRKVLAIVIRDAPPGPWHMTERHGRDIADEGWSELAVAGPDGKPLAFTYLTGQLEHDDGDDLAAFIVAARTFMPRLVAALDAILAPHRPGRYVILGRLCDLHKAHRHFSITDGEAAQIPACPDCTATVYASCAGCGRAVRFDSCRVRQAITRALTGEDTPDGE